MANLQMHNKTITYQLIRNPCMLAHVCSTKDADVYKVKDVKFIVEVVLIYNVTTKSFKFITLH